MEQGARIYMVVVIVRQKHRRRFGQERSPQRGDGGFREPGQEPGVEQEGIVPLAIQQRRMAQVHGITILHGAKPALSNRRLRRTEQAFVLVQRFHEARQHGLGLAR